MRVLVTGSSGLIGSALIPALQERGHDPVRLRRGDRVAGDLHWDPEAESIDDLSGLDAVIHLAGVGIGARRWSSQQKTAILDSRTVGTRLLSWAIAQAEPRPQVLLSASAIGYYGDGGEDELTEESRSGDDFQATVCVQWEAATAAAAKAGVRTAHMRTGLVLASHDGVLKRMLLPFKLGLGGRIGSGDQYMSWISLQDTVGAIIHLLDGSLSGPVNLTAPNPVTNAEFTKTLGDVLGRPTFLPTPLLPLKAVYGRELVETLLLSSLRVVGTRLSASGYDFKHPTLEQALRTIL
ncbi:MAG: TIGR01777 family oxidoreductase [Acidimicrobiia bacterium]